MFVSAFRERIVGPRPALSRRPRLPRAVAAEQLLLDFAVVLIAAEIGGALFRRIRLPRAVGMLVAGILLGPFTPGYIVEPNGPTANLAVLGAVFLMFTTGLSFDIRNFRKLGIWPFLLAASGVGTSFLGGLSLGLAVGWPALPATFLGLILTSTSTTLSLKLLADTGFGSAPGADVVTASILIDDIVALIFMTAVVSFASPSPVPPISLVLGLLLIFGLAAFLVFIGRHALPPILRATDAVSPPSVVMFAVSFGLLISFAFAVLGLPPLVGAFFAGSIVASTEYGPRVSRHITPLAALFMGVFFATIGLLIDPSRIPGVLLLSLATIGVAAIAKFLPALFVLRRLSGVRTEAVWPLATFLIPRKAEAAE
ncbi:MAG: cation:proton antiporter [Methanobacteriota archaeon]|nr:MAG: cation:proton antiporter [Euryarchaeota archaeon]